MATHVRARGSRTRASPTISFAFPDWPAPAWGAIGVSALFIAITCWWLTQDRSIPIFDAGLHLGLTVAVHEDLNSGKLLKALTHETLPYPPFVYLIGVLGMEIGGVSVAAPIVTENIVFVTLLALGCYKVARLAFNPLAGLLAVVFALGSPLMSAQFHVFMIDAPETAMVAVCVWLIIATEGFMRIRSCLWAGIAVGLGMLTKEPVAFFVAGIVIVTLLRGGRRSWRGFAVFTAVVLAIALPWYIREWHEVLTLGKEASASTKAFVTKSDGASVAPPRLSSANFEWYFWNFINAQLYLPMFLFAAVGWVWTMIGFVRRRPVSGLALELAVGSFLAWALLTETFVHDTRYSMPLLIYLAVFAAGWIVRLPHRGRIAAAGVLVAIALLNTLGATFGVGPKARIVFPGAPGNTLQQPDTITIAANQGFIVSQPRRDGDLLGLLKELKRRGVVAMAWPAAEAVGPEFAETGVFTFGLIAGLHPLGESIHPGQLTPQLARQVALLEHVPFGARPVPPCIRLSDGSGVWVQLSTPSGTSFKFFCPRPKPHFYG